MSSFPTPNTASAVPANRPNEQGTVHVQGFVKISDPKTGEVILEQRS